MNVQLIDRDPVTLACLRLVGPYGQPISDFWRNVVAPWMVTNNLGGRPRYGIGHDNPQITAPEQCRYDAGIEVPPDFVPNGPAVLTTLPGGRYAALEFRGGLADIGPAWVSMMREWLPNSGFQLDARPLFEYYSPTARYEPETGIFECQICVPVMAL